MRRRIAIPLAIGFLGLGAANILRAELLSQALMSFPASTKSLEYDDLGKLRKLRSYATLRKQYSGASLDRVQTAFSRLGITEDSIQEIVSTVGSADFYGIVSGTFSGIQASKRAAKFGFRQLPVESEHALCSGDGVCVIFLQDSLAAFGEADGLKAMLEARQGLARRLSADTPIAQLLAKADLRAPVIGVAPGNDLASWIGDSVPSGLLSPANLSKALDNISLFQYSVHLDARAHLKLILACASPLAAVSLREALSAINMVNSLSGGDATSSFDHLTVGSNEKLVHLTMDANIQ